MKTQFEDIYVREGLEQKPEVQAFLDKNRDIVPRAFGNINEIVVRGQTMAEKIANGKKTLGIDRRSSSLVDEFVNHDPGAICPNFTKLVPGTNCRYSCEYCFLQGTYRACRPFVCVYVIDFDKLEKDLGRKFQAVTRPAMVNAGEMSDPVACDVLGNAARLIELFAGLDKVKLLLLTKSGYSETVPLLRARHGGNTVLAWSINCDAVIAQHEHGTASLSQRLAAAYAAQQYGYEVRFRLDPMLRLENWGSAYASTVRAIYDRGIRPSRITLGSFRLLGNLRGIIKARFPNSNLLDQPLEKKGKRWRYPHCMRKMLYRHAIQCIRKHDPDVPIALCKETQEMHEALDGLVDPQLCNCVA